MRCFVNKWGGNPPSCPECGEVLQSHAGRGHKWFHIHVTDGPYPNPEPHPCRLVDAAFEQDGMSIPGWAETRYACVEAVHGTCRPTPAGEA